MRRVQRLPAMILFLIALLLCSCIAISSANGTELYVSPDGNDSWAGDNVDKPFASILKARNAIRILKKKGKLTEPVTVYLRGGLYEFSEPLIFTLEDSGTESYPITYKAYSNEKPVISGGRKITGPWKTYKGKIMVCSLGEVKKGKWRFRQLFVNGKRQIRARIPDKDYYKTDKTEEDLGKSAFKFKESDFKKWQNLNDVEVIIFHSWNESRLFVSELDEMKRTVMFTGPIGRALGRDKRLNRYYIENVLEGLDQPEEWYLDTHTGDLYYWPVGDIEKLDLRAPVLNQLVRFEGNVQDNKYVQYSTLSGLTFSDADYVLPKEGIPTLPDVGDIYKPSAITLDGVAYCTFKDNCIRNVGTYALEVTGDGNQITGNEIYDTGSGGIITRSYGKERNVISYNHIHNCGEVFYSGVGINVDDGGGEISHNLIHDISQTGIYARHWATKTQLQERRNQEQGLIIDYNEIYKVMQKINDGGGIFVRDSNILIRNNLIHDVYSYGNGTPGWGIYLGCETRDTRVENNLVYRTREGMHIWHGNRNNIIENNVIVDGEICLINANNPKDRHHENIKILRNIFYYTKTDADLFKMDGERSVPVESDYNIFWNPRGCIWLNPVIWGMPDIDYFKEWQEHGFDTHSIVKDPMFLDMKNDDYSLKSGSPAFKLGFKPIDISTVGLRGKK